MVELLLRYGKPAENSVNGWENESLPIGNGYMGVSVFGGVEEERLQITDPTLFTRGKDTYYRSMCGMADIYCKFSHVNVKNYERGLDLNTAKAYVKYTCDGTEFVREYFTSYPSNLLIMKFTSSKKGALNFEIAPEISYVQNYHQFEGDGGGISGEISVTDNKIVMSGKALWFNINFEAQLRVLFNSGVTEYNDKSIVIKDSDEVVVAFGEMTSYKLSPDLFLEEDDHKKLAESDPHNLVEELFANCKSTYEELEKEHLNDYQNLFFREKLDLTDGVMPAEYTDELLQKSADEFVPYLEQLYFQYSRYMMIASSRKGGVPASLQGIWNMYQHAPWGSGIWHNINVQMNYWLSFAGNIPETFEPYVDYFKAYLPAAQKFADDFVKMNNPDVYEKDGDNGFAIGTAATPYHISPLLRGDSGPGNVGLTSVLFWLYYDYTRDINVLKNDSYPALEEASKFFVKSVKKYDNLYLANFSASPEQNCVKRQGTDLGSPYNTVGCAYDQQMISDNAESYITASRILGIENDNVKIQKEQIGKYNPVEVGWSGQIKEYGEENFYGEIGEYCHRHISHLVGLYPGSIINSETPAWMDAAKVTLNERGDNSTGWALAHRMCAWSRTGDGNRVHKLFNTLLTEKTNNNLWDMHPPFQIDGNFGAATAIAEMLVQSHEGFIKILPALPDCWKNGNCSGFAARGGFDVGISWKDNAATEIIVTSKAGAELKLNYYGIASAKIECNGKVVDFDIIDDDKISIKTKQGDTLRIYNLKKYIRIDSPYNLTINRNNLEIKWEYSDSSAKFNIYRACDSAPVYEKIASEIEGFSYTDSLDFNDFDVVRYKVTAAVSGIESEGVVGVINHATQLQIDRYTNSVYFRKPINKKLVSNQLTIPNK